MTTQTTAFRKAEELADLFQEPHHAIVEMERNLGRTVRLYDLMRKKISEALADAYDEGYQKGASDNYGVPV